jgi:hypothetical protein
MGKGRDAWVKDQNSLDLCHYFRYYDIIKTWLKKGHLKNHLGMAFWHFGDLGTADSMIRQFGHS